MSRNYQIILADIPLNIQIVNEEISADLGRWLLRPEHPMFRPDAAPQDRIPPFTAEDFEKEKEYYQKAFQESHTELTGPALEFEMLLNRLSDALLKYDAFVFHGVAFLWREKAYIFTAPSGTGKTTQYRRWREVYGDEVRILNGDKPVLRFADRESHSARTAGEDHGAEPAGAASSSKRNKEAAIWVYPSPWHGKEGYARGFSRLPLGGIVFLEQGEENRIRKMEPEEAGIPLFTQLLFSAADAASVQQGAALIERMAREVPIWKLENLGDHASAKLTHDTILAYEEREDAGLKRE